ncbi:AAA domain-containing protein [Pedobacter heparinus]|uniref:DEAD-like helicase n=1 Tax=Pedobacter heparinus (strain ATCC 13125 / DSM 2366 / CIP 104194 / JCM 7457 / NBRC 12017 / NCIMB 9290 / NRRL B-14731 / HIM 762-3) TaxID=485917 RepID=C6Y493_PEDHD|nr:AAA domain-containing protein [Pedobacter heparinus]ACU05536.1 DEAD-like helicase [Pedobacter heparinus DSM 2366]
MPYFKKLLDLLKTEREEDLQAYIKQKETLSVAERRALGLTWYPIAIRGSEMSRGDYLTVEVERTTHHDLQHQLRFGMPAVLFSNHDPKNDKVEGLIAYQGGSRLKITLCTDELPDWARNGKLGIDVLFDDHSYDEMQAAVKRASVQNEQADNHHLIKILTGIDKPSFAEDVVHYPVAKLNKVQQLAVYHIVAAQQLAIVHGPPGTGKTTTLVQAVKTMIKQHGRQILVVAPSNTAVDLLSEKLADEGLNVLRIGNPVRVSEKLFSLTLDSKMSAHASIKEVKDLKKQAAEYKKMAHKYKRNFGRAEKEQRKALFDEAHKLMKAVAGAEQYIIEDLIGKAQVVTATLVGANHYTIKDRKFDTVVIDEAGQALEPACWIPILKAQKVILAGDHCQLPPTIKSNDAAKAGLSTTLLEKCIALHPNAVVLLEEQYRMHTQIMAYSSKVFYEGKLKAHAAVAGHLLFPGDTALNFIDTAGCGFEEQREGTSIYNSEEAVFLLKHLTQLVLKLAEVYVAENFPSIGVISPYKQQIYILKDLLLNHPVLQLYIEKISVNTIDSFQGQERDIVYIGMTRSNNEGVIGFLSDIRRMNVAMTRARKKLVVIGDSATLSRLPFYSDFIAYAESIDAYRSAWEFADAD